VTAAVSPASAFDAIVLAGGRATRLGGADKAGLVVAGEPILGSVVGTAVAAGAREVIVVGPDRPGFAVRGPQPPGGVRFVAEEPPAAGPVPAVRRGLGETRLPMVALLAADLPFLRAGQLRLLLGSAGRGAGTAGAVLVDGSGRPQWLVSCWQAAGLRSAAAAYLGTSLHGLLGPLDPVLVSYDLGAGEAPPWFDCDTADDLWLARHWPADRPAALDADVTREAR
jgi:molybdopterin-guanine dinucleotide biosynthesis protein A